MSYHRFIVLIPFVFVLAFQCGCTPKGPKVYRVEGIVTLDGKPVAGANVSFAPKQAGAPDDLSGPLLAGGSTDADGKYTLSTTRGSAVGGGTTAGEYQVAIVKKKMANALTAPLAPGQRFVPQYEYEVPKAFEDSKKSNISVEVVKGKNVFNFALKSDGTCEVTK
ncbi:MAG: DUF4198 domain-containing protein [Planctomycetaceae bacterium]|nr:DUF4198 domain-containing protein [Planctomycetaceae bacterium]